MVLCNRGNCKVYPAVLRVNKIAEFYEREARDLLWPECRTTGDRALSTRFSGLRLQDRESSSAEHTIHSSIDSCSEPKNMEHSER